MAHLLKEKITRRIFNTTMRGRGGVQGGGGKGG